MLSQFPGLAHPAVFNGVNNFAKIPVILLKFRFFHGEKSIVIAMNVVVDRMQHRYVYRVSGNLGQCHVELLINIYKGVALGTAPFNAFQGFGYQFF